MKNILPSLIALIGTVLCCLAVLPAGVALAGPDDASVGTEEAPAGSPSCLTSIQPQIGQQGVVVLITADREVSRYDVFRLSHPERVVLDIPVPKIAPSLGHSIDLRQNPYVRRIRLGAHHGGKTRMVLDLAQSEELPYEAKAFHNGLAITIGKHPEALSGEADIPSGKVSTLLSIEVEQKDQTTNVYLTVDGLVNRYESFMLHDPHRLILDLFSVRTVLKKNAISFSNPKIHRIRVGATAKDRLLLSLDLRESHDLDYDISQDGHQLIISLRPTAL